MRSANARVPSSSRGAWPSRAPPTSRTVSVPYSAHARLEPVELEAAGRTRPRGGQLAEGGGEALADRAAHVRVESESAPRVREHRDIDPGEPKEGPEHQRQAHPAREPAGEARMAHEHQLVAGGEGPHRIEPEDGRAEQDTVQPGRPDEVEVEVDRFERRRYEREVQAAPARSGVRVLHRVPAPKHPLAELREIAHEVLIVLDQIAAAEGEPAGDAGVLRPLRGRAA